MRKTFLLRADGKHPDRVLEAVKHEIRKYIKRERRRDLPEGADFWDFDCKFGADKEAAVVVTPAQLTAALDALVQAGGAQCYVELLAKPAVWERRPAGQAAAREAAQSEDAPDTHAPAADRAAS
jgi:Family of unknown function (DUF6172)